MLERCFDSQLDVGAREHLLGNPLDDLAIEIERATASGSGPASAWSTTCSTSGEEASMASAAASS